MKTYCITKSQSTNIELLLGLQVKTCRFFNFYSMKLFPLNCYDVKPKKIEKKSTQYRFGSDLLYRFIFLFWHLFGVDMFCKVVDFNWRNKSSKSKVEKNNIQPIESNRPQIVFSSFMGEITRLCCQLWNYFYWLLLAEAQSEK